MSLQVFLQAQLLGSEEFLSAPSVVSRPLSLSHFLARSAWLSLLCEVIPRALLAELKLSRMLLGASSSEHFFLLLPEEAIPAANQFLEAAAADVAALSQHTVRLTWVATEELGSWPVARKRLHDAFLAKQFAPLASVESLEAFHPIERTNGASEADQYFDLLATGLSAANQVGWFRDKPAHFVWGVGDQSWRLVSDAQGNQASASDEEPIVFTRRGATNDAGDQTAELEELAIRAEGTPAWGILCGDVDQFASRLRAASTIEDYLQTSFLFKSFFAGELGLLCAMPPFWRKVTLLFSGGDDFAVIGSWDALLALGRELQRIFEKFIAQNEGASESGEGKTISMALAIAPDELATIAEVYRSARQALRVAKGTEPGSFSLFGQVLEGKRVTDAEDLKNSLMRLANDFGFGGDFIADLTAVYRESFAARSLRRNKTARLEKPWRTYMQVSRVLPTGRSKEALNVRNNVLTSLLGKRTSGLKLRPSARVGLHWAHWAAGL